MENKQAISDVHVMLEYIERLVRDQDTNDQVKHLSGIGDNTLEIIQSIKTLDASMSSISSDVLVKHAEILDNSSVITKESLQALIDSIESNEIKQKEIHEEIQDIFKRYEVSVSKVMSTMTQNKRHQEELVGGLDAKITQINDNVGEINEKTLSKNDMATIMSEISDKLSMMIKADEVMDKQNQETLQSINTTLTETKQLLVDSNDKLNDVKEMNVESTSRMAIIDTKLDAMTEYITGEE